MRKREREREGQLANSWLVVIGPQRAREVSRCAKVTLYNNSFGFMLWVVYILCVPRDNHETANDPGSLIPTALAQLKNQRLSRCLRQFDADDA